MPPTFGRSHRLRREFAEDGGPFRRRNGGRNSVAERRKKDYSTGEAGELRTTGRLGSAARDAVSGDVGGDSAPSRRAATTIRPAPRSTDGQRPRNRDSAEIRPESFRKSRRWKTFHRFVLAFVSDGAARKGVVVPACRRCAVSPVFGDRDEAARTVHRWNLRPIRRADFPSRPSSPSRKAARAARATRAGLAGVRIGLACGSCVRARAVLWNAPLRAVCAPSAPRGPSANGDESSKDRPRREYRG